MSDFDRYAQGYDEALGQGLAVSGEGREFFARRRIAHLRGSLARLGARPRRVLDFGCGTGDTAPLLDEAFAPELIVGVDDSGECVAQASRRLGSDRIRFAAPGTPAAAAGPFDLAYCNGVFHHVPPAARAATMGSLAGALRAGGLLSLWDNNPWNPGARLVMRRIPFDRDAVMLSSREAARLARDAGLEVLAVDFLFLFPRALSWLRPLEALAVRAPLGAQYQVLCRKP